MSKVYQIAFKSDNNTKLLKNYENNKSLSNNNNEHLAVTPPRNSNNNKTITYVSSAVALASFGVTTALAIKNKKF